jgi:hypothetical protein
VVLIYESRGDSNRCTPFKGKPDQHVTRFPHSVRVWPSTIRILGGPRIVTFCVAINRFEQIHWPREEGLPTQFTVWWLTDPWVCTQLISHNNQWRSGEKSNFYWWPTTRLTGPIYQHVISTFNTCSQGPTHRSLIDTSGGYNLGGADFLYHTLRPSQPVVSAFHLRAPPGL